MRRVAVAALSLSVLAAPAFGASPPSRDALLDRLVGSWVLRGTLAGKTTTHDITSTWVLNGEYLQIHETSREKKADGQPQYEAVVLIGFAPSTVEYQCLWLDSTGPGGLTAQAFGRGIRSGDTIPFLFREADGTVSFSNTFSYEKTSDSWAWQLDNIQKGKAIPFGRVRLTRP